MARGPKAVELFLTAEERLALARIARQRKSGQALAQRARIVLACAEPGATNMAVARPLRRAPAWRPERRAAQRSASQGGR